MRGTPCFSVQEYSMFCMVWSKHFCTISSMLTFKLLQTSRYFRVVERYSHDVFSLRIIYQRIRKTAAMLDCNEMVASMVISTNGKRRLECL